jgi:hypothetical protein
MTTRRSASGLPVSIGTGTARRTGSWFSLRAVAVPSLTTGRSSSTAVTRARRGSLADALSFNPFGALMRAESAPAGVLRQYAVASHPSPGFRIRGVSPPVFGVMGARLTWVREAGAVALPYTTAAAAPLVRALARDGQHVREGALAQLVVHVEVVDGQLHARRSVLAVRPLARVRVQRLHRLGLGRRAEEPGAHTVHTCGRWWRRRWWSRASRRRGWDQPPLTRASESNAEVCSNFNFEQHTLRV